MTAPSQQAVPRETTRETELSLEVVLLLLYGVFLLLFGALMPGIQAGTLPYGPDSAYGLFLVLVAIQMITLGKTPFGDLRRSWAVVIVGIAAAVFGMAACFVPGKLTGPIRISVGVILAAGGLTLLLRLVLSDRQARLWMKYPGAPRHITFACGVVFPLTIALGLSTLFPGFVGGALTAGLLVVYGIGFLYLACAVQAATWGIARAQPEPAPVPAAADERGRKGALRLLSEASLPLSLATIVLMAVLLTLLGFVLVLVNLGLIPFSPDGLQGLLLVLFSIQMLALGDTPVGRYRKSWPMIAVGIAFAGAGAFTCIAPGILTEFLRTFLGVLNIFAGLAFFGRRFLEGRRDRNAPPPGAVPPIVRRISVTQTILNAVVIAFGSTMFFPKLVPGLVNAGIIVANGALLFVLAAFLHRLQESARQ